MPWHPYDPSPRSVGAFPDDPAPCRICRKGAAEHEPPREVHAEKIGVRKHDHEALLRRTLDGAPAQPTPGPWKAEEEEPFDLKLRTIALGQHRRLVADIPLDDARGREDYNDESRANARLIAAAPQMAALLLSAWQHVSHGGPKRGEVEDVLRQAGLLP